MRGGDRCGGNGTEYSFKTPPSETPITFAIAGEFIFCIIHALMLNLIVEVISRKTKLNWRL